MKKEAFLDSVYTVEPKSATQKWTGHWNFQWGSRISTCGSGQYKWRQENKNTYTVQDKDGTIWFMDKEAFNDFIKQNISILP